MRDILDKLEQPAVRWGLVCVGVLVLVRLRLILFAAALPVVAYWHYSHNASEEPAEASEGAGAKNSRASAQDDHDDDDFGRDDFAAKDDEEVYDKSFWTGDDKKAERSAPSREPASRPAFDDEDDDFGFGSAVKKDTSDDVPKARSNMDDILGSLGSLGPMDGGDDDFGLGKIGNDFDFLGGGGGDFLSSSFGGGFGGGKGKGKKGDFKGGEKGDKGPREANPKQVFVAGIGEAQEDELRMFFEEAGEVDRLKVLTTPEGDSKGVCFVTFRSEEQAQAALRLHGSDMGGRNITVKLANGGKGDKGEGKGAGGGGFGGGGKGKGGFGGDRAPMDLGGPSERFGAAFGDNGDRGSFGGDRPKGGKKGGGRGRERSELDELLEEALADQDGPVKASDFDFAARRFLSELRSRDRQDDTSRFGDALEMVFKYTNAKDRSSVRKWPAYIFTLLQKFDTALWEQLREKDAARRAEKGGGGGGGFSRDRPPRTEDDD